MLCRLLVFAAWALSAASAAADSVAQDIADEAFADLLKKHKQPVGLIASLKESVQTRSRPKRKRR